MPHHNDVPKRWVTVDEAAKRLGSSYQWVHQLIADGRLTEYTIVPRTRGRTLVAVDEDELDRFIREGTRKHRP